MNTVRSALLISTSVGALACAAEDTKQESPAVGGEQGQAGSSGGGGFSHTLGGVKKVECAEGPEFAWPNGARIAVSLTYDDALPTHIKTVGPALSRHGLLATFFINSGRFQPGAYLFQQSAPWQALYEEGHEFASHTVNHPCNADWVEDRFNLKSYDLTRMGQELDDSLSFLKTLGANHERYTFAYPCGQTWVTSEDQSYKPLVQERFAAARGTNWGPADPKTLDFMEVPGFAVIEESERDMEAWLHQTAYDGTWLIYTIHGVGGDDNKISAEAHENLLARLASNRDTMWVDTFGTIAWYVERCR